jgi:hypothetical protein
VVSKFAWFSTLYRAEILRHAYNKGYLSFAMANRKRQLSLKEQLGLAALQAGSRLNVEYLRTLYSRASSGVIESGGFPLATGWASLSSLIRLWEAGRWRQHILRTCACG